jgi:hypothetical protein
MYMRCALLHVKIEVGLSTSVSRNGATLHKKTEFKTGKFQEKKSTVQTPPQSISQTCRLDALGDLHR